MYHIPEFLHSPRTNRHKPDFIFHGLLIINCVAESRSKLPNNVNPTVEYTDITSAESHLSKCNVDAALASPPPGGGLPPVDGLDDRFVHLQRYFRGTDLFCVRSASHQQIARWRAGDQDQIPRHDCQGNQCVLRCAVGACH